VGPDRLRFDFSSPKPLEITQIKAIEDRVQQIVSLKTPVFKLPCSKKDALQISALRIITGEDYPDPVRVVSVGLDITSIIADPKNPKWFDGSIEFCGGTHLDNTGEAQDFIIVSEEGISKGVRRIVAVTAERGQEAIKTYHDLLSDVDELEKKRSSMSAEDVNQQLNDLVSAVDDATISAVGKATLRDKIASMIKALVSLHKEEAKKKQAEAGQIGTSLAEKANANKAKWVVDHVDLDGDVKPMFAVISSFFETAPNTPILLFSTHKTEGRVGVVAEVPPSLQGKLNALEWIRVATSACDGKGGGKADRAQGASRDSSKLPAAINAAVDFVSKVLA